MATKRKRLQPPDRVAIDISIALAPIKGEKRRAPARRLLFHPMMDAPDGMAIEGLLT